ncbi:MAG: hypothetical protein JRF57_07885 [Deltaproteobacteria bacterium]|nr:hypothetical protein [Deltaproteobacteria bacterium]MBW2303615.1 hypothetical protein [Deltaproteobacteria bacterium]
MRPCRKVFLMGIFLLSVLFSALLLQGCSGGKEGEKREKSSAKTTSKATSKTSIELILEDLKAGKIDYETALIYQVYAVFKHHGLPRQYASDKMTRRATTLFKEIREKWDTLSPAARNKLRPFLVNPLSPESFYMKGPEADKKKKTSFLSLAYAGTPPMPNTGNLNHYDAANGKVKIWYRSNERQQAQWILESFDQDKVFEKETTLMGRQPKSDGGAVGTDQRLDIFLANMSDMGLTVGGPVVNHKTYVHIFINKGMSKKEIQNSTAHEFFHAIQYNMDCNEASWWMEMTATWCEDFIYPDYDIEHQYLDWYFKNFKMRKSLAFEDGKHEYGAYVWPLYLVQKHGKDIIGKIWRACESSAALTAFVNTIPGGVEKAFKEFSLWMYNEEPAKYFRDGARPGRFLPAKPSISNNRITVAGSVNTPVNLSYLSLTMERFYFKPGDKQHIRSIDFDLTNLHKRHPKLAVWAIIKIAGEIEVQEDWSGVDFRNYCFDLPEEDLEEIVFIFANPTATEDFNGANLVDYTAKEYGCDAKLDIKWDIQSSWAGDWEYLYPNSGGMKARMGGKVQHREGGELSVSFIENIVDPEIADDPESGKRLVPYGGFSYHSSGSSRADFLPVAPQGLRGSSSIICRASDTWEGDERSKATKTLLRLKIIPPEKKEERVQVTEEELNQMPEEMRNQVKQLLELSRNLQNSMGGKFSDQEPKEGELKYSILLSFGALPATSTVSMGVNDASNVTESTTITPDSIELEGVFKQEKHVIPINKTIRSTFGSAHLTGTLRLKKKRK